MENGIAKWKFGDEEEGKVFEISLYGVYKVKL